MLAFDDELEQMMEDAEFEELHPCARPGCHLLPISVEPVDDQFYETTCTMGHQTLWERNERPLS